MHTFQLSSSSWRRWIGLARNIQCSSSFLFLNHHYTVGAGCRVLTLRHCTSPSCWAFSCLHNPCLYAMLPCVWNIKRWNSLAAAALCGTIMCHCPPVTRIASKELPLSQPGWRSRKLLHMLQWNSFSCSFVKDISIDSSCAKNNNNRTTKILQNVATRFWVWGWLKKQRGGGGGGGGQWRDCD